MVVDAVSGGNGTVTVGVASDLCRPSAKLAYRDLTAEKTRLAVGFSVHGVLDVRLSCAVIFADCGTG